MRDRRLAKQFSTHSVSHYIIFFFFNDTATTEIYTLSLHDALPISFDINKGFEKENPFNLAFAMDKSQVEEKDRKSTRLNSSHGYISYAVFCLKKKKMKPMHPRTL